MNGKVLALVIGAIVLLFGLLAVAHVSPVAAVMALYHGSLGGAMPISGTLRESTPLLIAGLAVFLALRGGLFNIGVEGQLLVGSMTCAAVALRVPGYAGVVLGAVFAMVAGALWALPAAAIKAYRNGHEVITTIMLNAIAIRFTDYLVAGVLKDPAAGDPTTASISTRLPSLIHIGGFELNLGLAIGIVATFAMYRWLKSTVPGYELQIVGANPTAARFAGVEPKRGIMMAMLASGAIAGFAGAVQVLAYEGRFYSGFSPGYGFDALGVALLAGANVIGVLPASLLFGVLAKGQASLQIEGVPKGITVVILSLLILIAAALRYRKVKTIA